MAMPRPVYIQFHKEYGTMHQIDNDYHTQYINDEWGNYRIQRKFSIQGSTKDQAP